MLSQFSLPTIPFLCLHFHLIQILSWNGLWPRPEPVGLGSLVGPHYISRKRNDARLQSSKAALIIKIPNILPIMKGPSLVAKFGKPEPDPRPKPKIFRPVPAHPIKIFRPFGSKPHCGIISHFKESFSSFLWF